MNVNELQVGDWVTTKEFGVGIGQIEEIYSNTVKIKDVGNYDINFIDSLEIVKEFLVKNDFCYEDNIGYVYEDGYGNEVIVDLFDKEIRILSNRNIVFNMRYFWDLDIHKLQHAMRLCDVKKEIIL